MEAEAVVALDNAESLSDPRALPLAPAPRAAVLALRGD